MCRGKAYLAVARLQAFVIMDAGPPFFSGSLLTLHSFPSGTLRRLGLLCLRGAPVSMICVPLVFHLFIFVAIDFQLSTIVLPLSSVNSFFSNCVVVGSLGGFFCGVA